ncbi:hypothetical protein LSAT2_015056, partial [Lamellibrachia satsuma]
EALTCYECTYHSEIGNNDCKNPKSSGVGTCLGTACTKVFAKQGSTTAIGRGCVHTTTKTGCTSASHDGKKAELCYCETDRCNGVSLQNIAKVSVIALVVFATVVASWF